VYHVPFSDQVKYLDVWINVSLKDDDDDIQRQVKSLYCAAYKLRGTFDQCSPAVKKHYFVPIACQCMLANCGENCIYCIALLTLESLHWLCIYMVE